MTDLTPAQQLSRDVYITLAPHLRSVFADDTRDITNAILTIFADWLRQRAAWSATEASRASKADDFPDPRLVRDHTVAATVLTTAADQVLPS